jgi:hypothetical protein
MHVSCVFVCMQLLCTTFVVGTYYIFAYNSKFCVCCWCISITSQSLDKCWYIINVIFQLVIFESDYEFRYFYSRWRTLNTLLTKARLCIVALGYGPPFSIPHFSRRYTIIWLVQSRGWTLKLDIVTAVGILLSRVQQPRNVHSRMRAATSDF